MVECTKYGEDSQSAFVEGGIIMLDFTIKRELRVEVYLILQKILRYVTFNVLEGNQTSLKQIDRMETRILHFLIKRV